MHVVYPTKEDIEAWVTYVAGAEHLSAYLPIIDERWTDAIAGDFALTAMHPDHDDLIKSSTRLLHRITKNHHFPDGNKRSAVVNVALLLGLNRHRFTVGADGMYDLAKEVASSNLNAEALVDSLVDRFNSWIVPME